jgi:hypothetical protein
MEEASLPHHQDSFFHSASLPSTSTHVASDDSKRDNPAAPVADATIVRQLSADSGRELIVGVERGSNVGSTAPPPPVLTKSLSSLSVQERAAIRRAAILQRGSSRMALVSGNATDKDISALQTPAPALVATTSTESRGRRVRLSVARPLILPNHVCPN